MTLIIPKWLEPAFVTIMEGNRNNTSLGVCNIALNSLNTRCVVSLYVLTHASLKYSHTLQFYSLSCEVINYTLKESKTDICEVSRLIESSQSRLPREVKKFYTNTLP